MKSRPLFVLVSGVALLGFLVGACARRSSLPAQSALAATQKGIPGASHVINNLADLSTTYAAIARKVTPAVVNIQSTTIIPGRVLQDPFSDFFGENSSGMFREPDRKSQSLGSGVIVNSSGLIITNNHVIKNASQILVTLSDQRRFPGHVLGADADSDVAVVKIDAPNLPTLKWADSDQMQVGNIVLAVGSPFGLASTVTQGIISAKGRRDLGISTYEDFLQTDAAINPGNSGGALVDIDGDLIGINSAILSESGGNQGIGLAIPANLAHKVAMELAKSGHVVRGWLGIVVQPLTTDVATQLGLSGRGGVLVTGIYTHGPAGTLSWSQSGTDVLLSIDGVPITSAGQARNLVAEAAPQSQHTLTVWQDGHSHQYSVQYGRRPEKVQGV